MPPTDGKRNPRIDPKPGDVLRGKPLPIEYIVRDVDKDGWVYVRPIGCFAPIHWRRWAANAEVLHAAD